MYFQRLMLFLLLLLPITGLALDQCDDLLKTRKPQTFVERHNPADLGDGKTVIGEAGVVTKLEDVKVQYATMREQMVKDAYQDAEYTLKRFFNPPDIDAAKVKGIHAFEIYKNAVKQFRAFKVADEFLNKIPIGQLKLSKELMEQVHVLTMEGVYRMDEAFISKILPQLVPPPGRLEVLANYGFSPLTKKALTEAEYQAIKDNPMLGFIEVPFFSKPGKRRGIIKFPGADQSEKELEKLLEWYEANKTVLHPIELAAIFQRKFISIHPFHNGNGRTSRLLMDRILAEHGFPPAILSDMNLDLYIHQDAWVDEVAAGVMRYQEMANAGSDWYGNASSVGNDFTSAFATAKKALKDKDLVGNGSLKSAVKVDGEHFYLGDDGFFYNTRGIPYTLDNKTFYPVSDETYLLYTQNGKLTKKIEEQDPNDWSWFDQAGRRKTSKHAYNNFTKNARFMRHYNTKSLNIADYKVASYSVIENANKTDDFFLHDFQKDVFRHAVKIDDHWATAILSPGVAAKTDFESGFHRGGSQSMFDMLAQYQVMDLRFEKYKRFAKKGMKDTLGDIKASREKLYQAGQAIVKEYNKRIGRLSEKELALLKQTPEYRLFEDYLQHTPLAYKTFDEAMAATDDSVYLLRNDMAIASKIGFIPEGKMGKILNHIPFHENVITFLKKKAKEENADPKLVQFVERVLVNPYRNKGVDDQFQRMYVDMYLHAANYTAKEFTSFSTTVGLYARHFYRKEGQGAFAAVGGDTPYDLFLVKMKKKNALFNISSGFSNEYEVLAPKIVLPTSITKKYKREDYFFDLEKLPEEDRTLVQEVTSKVFNFDMSRISIND